MLDSLRARLFLTSTVVLGCAVALEMALVWHDVGGYFVRRPLAQVSTSLARANTLLGRAAVDRGRRVVALTELTQLVDQVGGSLRLLAPTGQHRAIAAWGVASSTPAVLPRGEVQRVLDGATWQGTAARGALGVEAVPAVWSGRIQGALVWSTPVAGQALTDSVVIDVGLAGLIALLFGILVWAWQSQRLTRPLSRLAGMASAIADGDLSIRADVRAPSEYASLAHALSSMAASLERSEVARREFLASVAHELRTPLTALGGFLQALGDGTVPTDRAEAYRMKCLEEVSRLNRLLEDLLDMAKSEAGRLDLAIRPIALGETVSRAILLWESAIRQKNLDVHVDLPAQTVTVEADADRVMQVVSNLLLNAVNYTPTGGAITVGLTTDGEWATIVVADTGPGIPPSELPRIWDRYYRFIPSGRARGTGLGLAIVRALVEAHGGTVRAVSDGVTATRFEVRLPLRSPLVARDGDAAPVDPARPRGAGDRRPAVQP